MARKAATTDETTAEAINEILHETFKKGSLDDVDLDVLATKIALRATEHAHIILPGSKFREVLDGTKTKAKALCGAWVTKKVAGDASICRDCFEQFRALDEPTAVAHG